jgi:hypothetical protein
MLLYALSALFGIKITNEGKRKTSKNDKSQDCRNSGCFTVVADSFYTEQAGGGHKAAFCHDYDAVSPAVDYYFYNGLYSWTFHSQLRVAKAPVAGRKATVRRLVPD